MLLTVDLNSKKHSKTTPGIREVWKKEFYKGRFTELYNYGDIGMRENLLIATLNVCLKILIYVNTKFVK